MTTITPVAIEESALMRQDMTMRDIFAASVNTVPYNMLQTLEYELGDGQVSIANMAELTAIIRYAEADAMMKERAK